MSPQRWSTFGTPSWRMSVSASSSATTSDTPFTSAVSLVVALDEALTLILQEGVPKVLQRCGLMAQATRAGVEAMGLRLFAQRPSNGVTAVSVPEGIDGKSLAKLMPDRSHVMIAGGQGEMAGKVVRIAHMGHIGPGDILAGLAALEGALVALGHEVAAGTGVQAAQAIFESIVHSR